ncbi:MAG: hypothetical protein IJI41_14480 [Anaerolineaceae bacterium]|nr:hypothetical protein [Anaerolineaceae bacterium]
MIEVLLFSYKSNVKMKPLNSKSNMDQLERSEQQFKEGKDITKKAIGAEG